MSGSAGMLTRWMTMTKPSPWVVALQRLSMQGRRSLATQSATLRCQLEELYNV